MSKYERIGWHLEPDSGVIYVPPSERETAIYSKTVEFKEEGDAGVYTGTINIPAASIVNNVEIRSSVLWAAGTTAIMDVGDSADPDGYYSQINLLVTTGELLVDEVINFNNLGSVDGAYITAATGSFEQTYLNGGDEDGYDIIGVITTVGTASSAGRTILTVYYSLPSFDSTATYVAT